MMLLCRPAGLPLLTLGEAVRASARGAGAASSLFLSEPVRLTGGSSLHSARLIFLRKHKDFVRFCFASDESQAAEEDDALSSKRPDQGIKEELRFSLAKLTELLFVLSGTISQVSATVQHISKLIEVQEGASFPLPADELVPVSRGTAEPVQAQLDLSANGGAGTVFGPSAREPWDAAESGSVLSDAPGASGVAEAEDSVPAHLIEQNIKAHRLVYQLQQAFVQARIEGLGKPFQLAIEDFVNICIEAHSAGLRLQELQLQLLLAEGASSGVFSMRSRASSKDPIMDEEMRVRSSWVRLVYATLAEVAEMRRASTAQVSEETEEEREDTDPSDIFVKQAVKMALEDGYNLERLKLEQTYTEAPEISKAIKMMRQSQYLVVLTLEKALGQRK